MKNSWENPLESSVLGPPTGSSFLALLPCFSIRRTEPSLFHVCYLGLLFSFLFFFFFLCLLCLAPGYHLLSPCLSIPWCLLPDLPAPHGCCRQCRAGRLCKISRYLPRKKSPPFLCTSVAVLNTHTSPFSTGWVLWRCQWLNKHPCLTCSSVRLLVAVVLPSNEPQEPQIPLLILSQVDAGELCWEMWWASCPPRPSASHWISYGTTRGCCCNDRGHSRPPACTQSPDASPHTIAISQVIFVKPVGKSRGEGSSKHRSSALMLQQSPVSWEPQLLFLEDGNSSEIIYFFKIFLI